MSKDRSGVGAGSGIAEEASGEDESRADQESALGNAPAEILDIRGFNLSAVLELDPESGGREHEHDEHVASFVFRSDKPFDSTNSRVSVRVVQIYGPELLRYKGVLYMKGKHPPRRVSGVHMLMGGDMGRPWGKGEKRFQHDGFHRKKICRRSYSSRG